MDANMTGSQALNALLAFNSMYDQIQYNAIANNNIGLTLESNFKAFIDQESRSANAATRHIRLIEADGHSGALASGRVLARVDFVAYGTYALAPNCAGNLQVTLHLVGKNRKSESFVATGSVDSVMALIADQVYATFAKTHFPSTVKIGSSQVTIIGGLNHGIDQTTSLKAAELSCTSRSGRLPNAEEIEMINNYGDGSGGVTLGTEDEDVYALPGGKVYVAGFHTDPVRDPSEINQRVYKYFCVR
jgi:predicted DNA-binding transcriptional regulator AlpA